MVKNHYNINNIFLTDPILSLELKLLGSPPVAEYSQKIVKIFTKYFQTWLYDWYQKFLVPPPIAGENRTKVNVSLSVTNIMDINEQVFV